MVFIWASKLASGSLWFCFTAPCNWLEKLTPVSQPMGTHTIHLLWLVRVICYFCLGFTTFIWKPYRAAVKPNHIWNEKFLLKTSLLTMGPPEEKTFKITFERRQAHLHVISWTLSICHGHKIDSFQKRVYLEKPLWCAILRVHILLGIVKALLQNGWHITLPNWAVCKWTALVPSWNWPRMVGKCSQIDALGPLDAFRDPSRSIRRSVFHLQSKIQCYKIHRYPQCSTLRHKRVLLAQWCF